MELTRREFLEQAGVGTLTVMGFSLLKLPGFQRAAQAAQAKKVAEIPVIWLATGSCSGCSVSLLNSASPTIQQALLDEILPGKHLSLAFHSTVMAAQGEPAVEHMEKVRREHQGGYVLVVEGATASKEDGLYCNVGESGSGPLIGYRAVRDLGQDAAVVLAVGTCASFGGIPAAPGNPTEPLPVHELLKRENVATPVVNIPGCPPHPDWIVGSIAAYLLGGAEALQLDELGRPGLFFSGLIHDNCPFRGHFDRGEFAQHYGEHGCLLKLGCKGPITRSDCSIRKFNNGTSWCIEAGHPCIGCTHEAFPFEESMFTPVEPAEMTFPGYYPPPITGPAQAGPPGKGTYAAIGLIGVGGFLAGVGIMAASRRLRAQQEEEKQHGSALAGEE